MENKKYMVELIKTENINIPDCIFENCFDCPDLEMCFSKAVTKTNHEFATSLDYAGYDSEEEFWENL